MTTTTNTPSLLPAVLPIPGNARNEQSPEMRSKPVLPPAFGNTGETAAEITLDKAIASLPFIQEAASRFMKMKESPSGNSNVQFVQDSAILWAPKAVISRSWLELFEISFVEFAESAFFYYVTPLLAGYGLAKVFPKLLPEAERPSMALITTPLKNLSKADLTKVAPVKLGIALAAVSAGALGNYALNFIKNVVTEKSFHINEFSSIIGFENKKIDPSQESHVTKKTKQRLKATALVGAGLFAASLGVTRFGPQIQKPLKQISQTLLNWSEKESWLKKPLQKIASAFDLEKMADILEFDYKQRQRKDKPPITVFDLGRHQLKFIVPVAVIGYIDAARDKLERVEVFCRTTITGGYIAFLQPWLAGVFNREYGKRFTHLNITKPEGGIKSQQALWKDSVALAGPTLKQEGILVTTETLQAKANQLFKPRASAHNQLFFIPFLFGILGVGMFTALMNRLWTNNRYQKSLEKAATKENPAMVPVTPPLISTANNPIQPFSPTTISRNPVAIPVQPSPLSVASAKPSETLLNQLPVTPARIIMPVDPFAAMAAAESGLLSPPSEMPAMSVLSA